MKLLTLALVALVAVGPPSAPPTDPAGEPGPGSTVEESAAPSGPATQTWAVVPATAHGPDGRGVIEHVVEPGDVYEDFVAVRNLGDRPITLTLYAHDARQTPDNSFEVLTPEDPALGIGAWLEPAEDRVTVEPDGHVVVPVALRVPIDAEPGDHAGGIVAVAQADAGETVVQYRAGLRVHLRVGGPVVPELRVEGLAGRYDASLSPVAPGDLTIDAVLVNVGNVRLTATPHVELHGLFGWGRQETEVSDLPELLRDAATGLTASFEDVPAMGPVWVTARVDRVESRGQDVGLLLPPTEVTVLVWAVSWPLVVTATALLAAAALAVRNLRLRHRARRAGPTAPRGTSADVTAGGSGTNGRRATATDPAEAGGATS